MLKDVFTDAEAEALRAVIGDVEAELMKERMCDDEQSSK